MINLVADELIHYIEDIADQVKGLRYKYLDTMAAQNWRNRDFEELLNIFMDGLPRALDKHDPHQRSSDESVIRKVVPMYVDGHYALMFTKSRAIDEVGDREYEEIMDAAERWTDDWLRSSRGSRSSRDSRGGRSSLRGRRVGTPYSGRDDRDEDTRRRPTSRRSTRSSNSFSRDEVSSGIASHGRSVRSPNRSSKVAGGMWGAVTGGTREEQREEPRREVERDVYIREEPKVTPPPNLPPKMMDGIDFTKERPHEEYRLGDDHWIHSSKVTPELEKRLGTHPTFYDVNTHLRYLVVSPNNRVREEFILVDHDNRYLQQELLNNPATVRRPTNQVSLRNPKVPEETVMTTKSVDRSIPLAEVIRSIKIDESDTSNVLLTGSISESIETLLLELSANPGVNGVFKTHIVRDLVVLIKPDPYKDEFLEALDASINLVQFHSVLTKYASIVDPNLWSRVNKRMSLALDSSMRYQWLLPGSKPMNFHNDYLLLLDKLKQRFANNPEYMSKYVRRTTALIQQVTMRVEPSEVSDYIDDLLPGAITVDSVNVVLFTSSEYLFAIRNTADALGIGKQLKGKSTGVAVRQLEGNDLQVAIRQLYTTLPFDSTVMRTVQKLHLVTHDGQMISIHPYECRNDEFILANSQ